MNDLVTTDTILNWLKEQVEHKNIISPDLYLDACTKLNLLISDEHDKLFDLQQRVAELKVEFIKADLSVAEAKTRVDATDTFKEMRKQEAKIGQIEEAIRIAKIRSRLKSNEMGNY